MLITPPAILKPGLMALLIAWSAFSHATEIEVSVQPENPIANESFRLVFRALEAVDAEPDFAELDGLIDILGRNRQTSIKWINGRNSHTTTWVLDVIATVPGRLAIPGIAFGSDATRPFNVEVHDSGNSRGGAMTDTGLLLEIEVDNETPYVQEQIILTARLLRRVELNDAKLTDPSTDQDAIIKRLGKDSTHAATRNGKRYEAFERRFSIFPQTSGRVLIDPLVLTTQLVQHSRSLFDPFRQSVKTRRIESNPIVLNVKPIPPSYTGATWLPARRLQLRDDWLPDDAIVQAGEPLTRTVFLWADGLNAGQLPELPVVLPDGLKSYPDQPQTSEQETGNGFSAIRQQKFAIIPNGAGELVFPETSITWWNTETDMMEVARLGERRFTIEGQAVVHEPAAGNIGPTAGSELTMGQAINPIDVIGLSPGAPSENRFVFFAIVALLGWAGTAMGWWLHSRRTRDADSSSTAPPPALSRARRDVIGACKAKDPNGAKRALIAWGSVAFEDSTVQTLGDLIRLVGAPLDQEIRRLNDNLYGNEPAAWDHFALKEAFEHSDHASPMTTEMKGNVNALPDLYRLSGQ